jgi:hypothetical protein
MNDKSKGSIVKYRTKDQEKPPSGKPRAQGTEWELTNELLDEALRQTFPASDAISIIQTVRGS